MIVTFVLVGIVVLLIYLLGIQSKAKNCQPRLGPNGEIVNGCPPSNTVAVPTSAPGQIQFLHNLSPQKIPQLDGQ